MNREAIVTEARDFVKRKLLNETTGHDWWHIERVTKWALHIARVEGADRFICELAALFHDLADDKLVCSEEEALKEIAQWLKDHQVDPAVTEEIIDIIATMSYRGGGRESMKSLQGRVVQDADRLDAMGAIGIARTFAYAGAKGNTLYDPGVTARADMTLEQYRNGTTTAINHFHEKLLKLKDLMNTSTAKAEAAKRHRFMEEYLKQFHAEWNA